jgi:hypothetical protein
MNNSLLKNVIGPDSVWFWGAVQAIGVITTLLMIYRQVRIGQLSSMLEALNQLEKKWTSPGMLNARKQICEGYQKLATRGSKELDVSSNTVLVFFEEIGLLYSLRILSRDLLWERLSYNIVHYWQLIEPKVQEMRASENDETFYDKFENIAFHMRGVEAKRTGKNALKTEAQLMDYIKQEIGHLDQMIMRHKAKGAASRAQPPG